MKTAVITGIRGQDSSYLAELLLDKGYKVVGLERRSSSPDYSNIEHLLDELIIEQGDITDFGSLIRILKTHQPDEFYNLAAQSFVGAAWDQALATCNINFDGTCNCLEAIRLMSPQTRFFQASTSEVYGDVQGKIQDEDTPARPRSPYAAAKYGAESLVKVYRESYSIFACFARSFNHESPRRGKQFVTRKITSNIGHMYKTLTEKMGTINNQFYVPLDLPANANGSLVIANMDTEQAFNYGLNKSLIQPIHLGNLDAQRDWSHAKDIVRGMWLMLQQDSPDDFVFASGHTRSVRNFVDAAFKVVGVNNWEKFVTVDEKLYRPADVNLLCGNPRKAKEALGWEPEIPFENLVSEMVWHDIYSSVPQLLRNQQYAV